MTLPIPVDLSDGADILCACGNDPWTHGHYPAVVRGGVWVQIEGDDGQTVPDGWRTWDQDYLCAQCGAVHHDTSPPRRIAWPL